MKYIFALCLLAATTLTHADAINPYVTQDNLDETVCNTNADGLGHSWVSLQRPPTSYTQKWEQLNGGDTTTVVDHVIPLCAGGNPRDYSNYQLQLTENSYKKDTAERLVCRLLCSRVITLKQAQQLFWKN